MVSSVTSRVNALSRQARRPVIRRVPALRVFSWLQAGWRLFIAQPAQWTLLALLVLILMFLASLAVLLPVIGPVLPPVLFVLLIGGCLRLAWRQRGGKRFRIQELLHCVGKHGSSLALVGVFYSIPIVLMALLTWIVSGGVLIGLFGAALGNALQSLFASSFFISVISAVVAAWGVTLLVLFTLVLSLIFSPALIVFRSLPPLDAMILSVKACWRNLGAACLFGLVMYSLFALSLLFVISLCVFIPMSIGALLQAYEDMFGDQEGAPLSTIMAAEEAP